MSIALSQEDQTKVKDYIVAYLQSQFGSDFALTDNGYDIQILGGDIRASGTFSGNTLDDVRKLVADRVNTRILTTPADSAVLPPGYGSFISSLVGMATELDSNVFDKVIQTYIFSALFNEPLIDINTLIISVVSVDENRIDINLSVTSGVIEIALNSQITG